MADAYLQILTSRFPRLELSIARLHRQDSDFRSICEEMEMAEMAHALWKDMPDRAAEYQRIFDRLQEEFLNHLSRKSWMPADCGEPGRHVRTTGKHPYYAGQGPMADQDNG